MSETPVQEARASAGALLRAARERQGMHVAALAAAIKIPQRKLEALESDRLDELPDATFARALALTVCRALKIDPAPVLAQLPQSGAQALADVSGGLNAPFRERPGRSSDGPDSGPLRQPLVWAALLVLAAAAAVFLLPAGWWQAWWPATTASESPVTVATVSMPDAVASAPTEAEATPAARPAEAVASTPTVEEVRLAPAAASSAAAEAPVAVAVLSATDASWVEVIDASGQVLVQRVLRPGESLDLDGRLPFKLKIGNAVATQLQFRGQSVDLKPSTRDNVARLELK